MADLIAGPSGEGSHHEVTYMGHDFVFRLADGRLAHRHKVAPAVVPTCPKNPQGQQGVSSEELLGLLRGLNDEEEFEESGFGASKAQPLTSDQLLGLLKGFEDEEDSEDSEPANGTTALFSVDISSSVSGRLLPHTEFALKS